MISFHGLLRFFLKEEIEDLSFSQNSVSSRKAKNMKKKKTITNTFAKII